MTEQESEERRQAGVGGLKKGGEDRAANEGGRDEAGGRERYMERERARVGREKEKR